MVQIGLALEGHFRNRLATLSAGWGLVLTAGQPWYRLLLTVIAQGAPGVRRFGIIVLGFFVTLQLVDVDGARKALTGAIIQSKSPPMVKNIRAGTAKGTTRL